ncbi:MAG TPA: PQQ-dependent sugar dehydrogenase [Vicinamibacteria bacterium]|nr:PQQ-dependent sugar dehydrogenase [Vicinamibacteria bacterium]
MKSGSSRLVAPLAAAAGLCLGLASCGGSSSPAPPAGPSTPSGSCASGTIVPGTPGLVATRVVAGLSSPLDLQSAPSDRTRLFVVEQAGRIRVVRAGALVPAPFLDISARISSGGERGLLGLAFHPQYGSNGRFFVNYTDRSGDTHISEFRAPTPSGDSADAASERELMFVRQPFSNHNGGGLAFGPDGFLYIGLGDGGSGGDPQGNAQNLGTRLGKMLRIDVNGATPFAVPPDNPFVGRAGSLPEIWAYGLRNPWRFSFDRATGDLYIGDVGQGALEEIDVGLASRRGAENYGWNTMEGSRCYSPSSNCNMSGLTLPVTDYGRGDGFSVTGGVVYRGCRMPGYAGQYFYADYGSGMIRSFRLDASRATDPRDWTAALSGATRAIRNPSSFGVDADGEIYIVDYDGEVYRIDPAGS